MKLKVELAKPAPRKKRIRGHRGSYPVGGGPSKQKKVKGDIHEFQKNSVHHVGFLGCFVKLLSPMHAAGAAIGGARNDRPRGDEGRSMLRGGRGGRGSSQKNFRGAKRKGAEERPSREERPRDKQHRGSKFSRGMVCEVSSMFNSLSI